ncbi:MAG: hypothetical protein FJ290_28880 [Planctomycetes bacterium]|nr:hypothetical protein [Planctomycetota bacterium]
MDALADLTRQFEHEMEADELVELRHHLVPSWESIEVYLDEVSRRPARGKRKPNADEQVGDWAEDARRGQ